MDKYGRGILIEVYNFISVYFAWEKANNSENFGKLFFISNFWERSYLRPFG